MPEDEIFSKIKKICPHKHWSKEWAQKSLLKRSNKVRGANSKAQIPALEAKITINSWSGDDTEDDDEGIFPSDNKNKKHPINYNGYPTLDKGGPGIHQKKDIK